MHRTACFGRCPDYMIEINNSGVVTYTAIRFCEDTGVFKKDIGASKAREIIDQFTTYKVDTCKDIYESRIQDVPGMVMTIKYKTTTKIIRDANFGPFFLQRLAEAIDAVGKKTDDTWKKVGDGVKK